MPPVGDVHITKDIPIGEFNLIVEELLRMGDAIGTYFYYTKRNPPRTFPVHAWEILHQRSRT